MGVSTDFTVLLTALSLLSGVYAHIALWHPSMYGWDPTDVNQNDADNPLAGLNFTDWWFHGWIDSPPAPGIFMDLPAGGTFHGEVSCSKAFTNEWGEGSQPEQYYACPTLGPLHVQDEFGETDPTGIRGCGLGIAYKSDVNDIQPEDFTIISTNYTCPWTREVDFQIPADLPPCPEGGCHCMWGWIHAPWVGSEQMYFLGYRCNVTNAGGTIPLPAPQIARKCPLDSTNCTVGSKQPHYWDQNERNNNWQGPYDPPYYNGDYGFSNGAQTDLFDAVSTTVVYTQTTWVEYELYYTNSPTTFYTAPIDAPWTNCIYSSCAATTSTSASASTDSAIVSLIPSITTSWTTTDSVAATSTISTTSSTPTALATTPSPTTSSVPTSTPTASINTSATEMGSPTYHAPVVNLAANSTASSSTMSVATPAAVSAGQCKGSLSRRAAKRLNDPAIRRKHEARAERRRTWKRSAMKDTL